MNEKPNYYSIIPAHVRYDDRLRANEKLMYGEITSLSNEKGHCWASNKYFAELYKVNRKTVSTWIGNLVKYGHVNSHITYKTGTNEVDKRYLSINNSPIHKNEDTPIHENVHTPIHKKAEDNITSINITSINNKRDTSATEKGQMSGQKKDKSRKQKPLYDDASPYFTIAKFLLERIRLNKSDYKEPNLQKWSDDVRKIIELDNRDKRQVCEVIKWAQLDDFWSGNILSPAKLRDKYDQLVIQMQNKNKPKQPNQSQQDDLPDWIKNDKRNYGF